MTTNPWWEGPLVGFDLETTGTDPENDRIVTASIIWDKPGQDERIKRFLVDPGVEIPDGAAEVHGITTEQARADGMPTAEGVKAVNDLIGVCAAKGLPIVAFNAAYDLTLLHREALRHGLEPVVPALVIDPLVIDRHIDRFRKGKRQLTTLAQLHNIPLENAHDSDFDARAAIGIARAIGRKRAVTADVAELQTHQAQWHHDWAENFENFLRRKGSDEVISREWPMRTAPVPVG